MGMKRHESIDEALAKIPENLRRQKLAFLDLVNEVTYVVKNYSTVALSMDDLKILREWAREYDIFIREHKSGHGCPRDCNYRKPHIHFDITGKGKHNRIHYLVDVTT